MQGGDINRCMDKISKERRSFNMSKIRSKDTRPEKLLRSALNKAGLRFHIHRKDLPGNPDIVFPKNKIVVFVHGCFWHGCPYCNEAHTPKTNVNFWKTKITNNKNRDKKNLKSYKGTGWV